MKCRDWVEKRAAACRTTISTPESPLAPLLCENQYKTYAYNCEHLALANLRKAAEENAGDDTLTRKLQELGRERRFPQYLHEGKAYVGETFLACMDSAFGSTYLADTSKACREAWEDDDTGAVQCAAEKAGDYYRHAMKCGADAIQAPPTKTPKTSKKARP